MYFVLSTENVVISDSCIMCCVNYKTIFEFENNKIFAKTMKRSNDDEEMDIQEFQLWKEFKKRISTSSNQSDEEKREQFDEFKEYVNLKNNYNKRNPDNLMRTPQTSMQSSSSSSSLSRTTTSESSQSSRSSDPSTAISEGHRQFQLEPLLLSPEDFTARLKTNLPESVLKEKLLKYFLPFNIFREKYILPLSEKYKGQDVELKDVQGIVKIEDFMQDYFELFIGGCHVTRKVRKLGQKGKDITPDTQERIMFRNLFTELWSLLGMIAYMLLQLT